MRSYSSYKNQGPWGILKSLRILLTLYYPTWDSRSWLSSDEECEDFTDFMESQLITSTVSAKFLPIPSPSISKEQRQEGGACSCLGQRWWWFILWLVEFSLTTSLVLSFSEAAFLSCWMRTGSADCAQGWLRPVHGVAQHPRSLFLYANQLLPSGALVPSHSPSFKCHVLFRRTIFDRSAPQSAGPSPNSYGF